MSHYTPASLTRLLALLAALPALAAAQGMVGPETCRACHPAAHAAWREGPHARAYDILPERSRKDARCLGCHSPQSAQGLSGVTCEACHGPGAVYSARHVMRDAELARAVGLVDPDEKTCLACHTESTPSLERFDYAKKRKLIAHPDLPPQAPPELPARARPAPGR
jgi:hypothetical protein